MINQNTDFTKWNSKESQFDKYRHIGTSLIYGRHNPEAKVSVVILSYKRIEGLKQALHSAIMQECDFPYDILVMDDSGEITEIDELMKGYCNQHSNIVYYRHDRNLGEPGNWNRSAEKVRTSWYCLLHDDDLMKTNYLSVMMNMANRTKGLGMIGVYVDFDDRRAKVESFGFLKKLLKLSIRLFLNLKKGKVIPLRMKDHMRDIYPISTCLFLNQKYAVEVGGSDDAYFPNSDSVFASKMSFYHAVAFVPLVLATRGVEDNQSLKQEVIDNSIKASYFHTLQMAKTLGYGEKKAIRKASLSAVIHEIMVRGYNPIDYSYIKKELNMKSIYCNKLVVEMINVYSKICWGKLLFRNGDKHE